MTSRARVEAALALRTPDRTPVLDGWIACPPYLIELAGATHEAYVADPFGVSVRAYEALGADGLLAMFIPRDLSEYCCVDQETYQKADRGLTYEEVCAQIDAMPSPETIEDEFDCDAAYPAFRQQLLDQAARCGEMVWMPAQWGAAVRLNFYGALGYENWFLLFALDEPRARKMLESGSARAWCHSRLLARAVEEGIYPRAVLLGEDICDQRGTMLRLDFLERYYAPLLRRGLEPLRAVGCRPVWHSDGNVRPMMDFLIDAGICGFQGFQPECGMRLEDVVERRTREGEPLLIFGPMAVTTELPLMTPEQVTARVHEAIEICRGQASLCLFTSNTVCPDVPLANIRAMYEAVR